MMGPGWVRKMRVGSSRALFHSLLRCLSESRVCRELAQQKPGLNKKIQNPKIEIGQGRQKGSFGWPEPKSQSGAAAQSEFILQRRPTHDSSGVLYRRFAI